MKFKLFLFSFILSNTVSAQSVDCTTEKLKALEFLQKNMRGCFSLSSDDLEKYYNQMNNTFKETDTLTNEQYRESYRVALHRYPFCPEFCDTLYDLHNVSLDYLKSNIDDAYDMWKKNSHHVSFETFCDYILPYRIGCEPLSDWRKVYKKEFEKKVSPYLQKQYNYYHLFSMHNMLNQGFNGAVYYPTGPIPEFSLTDLLKVKVGNCESYSTRGVAQLRAFGIPATIDFTPQWGNRSMGHSWGVMFVNDNYTLPFGLNESLGSHFDERPEITIPKVYRHTFKIQECLREISEDKDPNIPAIFKNQRYIDVTDSYIETSDVSFTIQDNKWLENVKWVYLAVFNNRDWIPVAYSKIAENKKATFVKVGRGVMYIPFCFDEFGRRHYVSDPFLLTREGTIKYMKANTDQFNQVIVTRKYWESETLKKYNNQLVGGKIIVSNTPDFKDSILITIIDSINENRYHTIPLDYVGNYKYIKYISPENSYGNIAEILLLDDNDNIISPIRCFGGMGAWAEHNPEKVFDGKELTSYSRISPNGAWAAAEFINPVHFSKLRIHPRTDGNAIYAGDVYQLLYWNNGKWNMIAEHKAGQEDSISFANVPQNALLLLHNASRGREERIFTYENGRQIWW